MHLEKERKKKKKNQDHTLKIFHVYLLLINYNFYFV